MCQPAWKLQAISAASIGLNEITPIRMPLEHVEQPRRLRAGIAQQSFARHPRLSLQSRLMEMPDDRSLHTTESEGSPFNDHFRKVSCVLQLSALKRRLR